MAEVNLVIDGRTYGVVCDDGQERRVQQLGAYIDTRIKDIAASFGSGNKAQLMVLTALHLADEIFESREHLQKVTVVNQQLSNEPKQIFYQGLSPRDEQDLSVALGRMSAKVEKMVAGVQKT
jgi:cell division protein ZapA